MEDTIEVVCMPNDSYVLRVRCAKCGTLTRPIGLPVMLSYMTDTKRFVLSRGLMCVRIDPAHAATCQSDAVVP